MIKSMTGFGRGEAGNPLVRMEVEMRGVNHRFLEIRFRMPQEMSDLEAELRQQVSQVARRGRVDVWVERVKGVEPEASVTFNRSVVAGYLEAAGKIGTEFSLPGSLDLQAVLALPGAVRVEFRREGGGDEERVLLRQALAQALEAFDGARIQEGGKLTQDLRSRLSGLMGDLEGIREAAQRSLPEVLEKIRKRMDSLLEGAPLDPGRLAQEAAYLAGRSDIAEEMVRLSAHLAKAQESLQSHDGPVGKSLDFLVQELHREVNTIASKSESLEISQVALRMKGEVERIREQVQNLE
ncbi:MAG: YicC family protein [Acidobacteria bacterium]|nr:YicC family protein [Acidobacteriota bacterium]